MIKKSTTKENAFLADKNAETFTQHSPILSFTYIPKQANISSHNKPHFSLSTTPYMYVRQDIKQTAVITSALFSMSILLYFILQNRFIDLSIFGY